MSDHEVLTIPTRGGLIRTRVLVGGHGYPLVWLHGGMGLSGWEPHLQALARHFTVYAPIQPGVEESEGLEHLENLWDLTLHYCDLLDALVLESPFLVGHSFGGMLAAEVAAMAPERVAKLVLVSPLGLWRDDAPILDYQAAPPHQRLRATFHDPAGPAARALAAAVPAHEPARTAFLARLERNMAATGRFCRPLPACGLPRRIYRICAPTLLVWGRSDGVVPPVYAYEFGRRLPAARVAVLERSGHLPHLEEPGDFTQVVTRFLLEG